MRLVIQRVSEAAVSINNHETARIGKGLLVLLGIEENDTAEDINWMSAKLVNMRLFADSGGLMNLCLKEVDGDILLVSQFTLLASTRKGNRPSFIRAAKPEQAVPLYEQFIAAVEKELTKKIATGVFGAAMQVSLVNDGPVTILLDSHNKE
jgi:D-aminoacyl-tRNA deacylase